MKKALLIGATSVLLISTPVLAVSPHANEKALNNPSDIRPTTITNHEDSDTQTPSVSPVVNPSVSPSVSPTTEPDQAVLGTEDTNSNVTPSPSVSPTCDPTANWKNHGAYVSCVAHEHLGGQAVSEAAHSDVGKKHDNDDLSPTPSVSETPTPSISETPTATPTGTPVTSALPTVQTGFNPLASVGDMFTRLFSFVNHLI